MPSSPAAEFDPPADRPDGVWPVVAAFLPGLLVAGLGTLTCYFAVGAGLGLFFGGVLLCAIVVPPLAVAEGGYGRALVAAASVAGGVSLAWLAVTLLPRPPEQPYPEPGDWAACTAAVGAFAFALAGLALVLRGARVGPPVASFATTLLGLAWLTWPVWLSPWLAGRAGLVGWLVPAHPLLAVNSVVRHLGIWDEQPLAYNLTTLNRDVPYPLPGGILRTVLVHGAIGVVLLSAAILPGRVRRGGVSGHG